MPRTIVTLPEWARPDPDLHGRTVVVVGGAGGVGEGVVRVLLDAGCTVVAAGRTVASLTELALRLDHPRLRTEQLDALSGDLDQEVAQLVGRHGSPDAVVVAVASWGNQGEKPALSLTDDEWHQLLTSNVTAVFRLYRAFVDHIAADGALIQLNGMSAEIPFPGNAGVALTAAAGKSLTLTVAAERAERGPRVYEVVLGFVSTRPKQLAGLDDPEWVPAIDAGRHVVELIARTSPLTGQVLHYFTDNAGPRIHP